MQQQIELKAEDNFDVSLDAKSWIFIVNVLLEKPMKDVRHTVESIERQLVESTTSKNKDVIGGKISKEEVKHLMEKSLEHKKKEAKGKIPKDINELQKEVRED